MAQRALEALPIPPPRRNYPWPDWMDGSTWELEQGVDFGASVVSFRNRCYSKATSVGMRATVNVIEEDDRVLVRVRFYDPEAHEGGDEEAEAA